MFKEQRRPTLLDHPPMDLGDLVHQTDGVLDADKLPALFEFMKKGLEPVVAMGRGFVGHGFRMPAEIVRVFALAQSSPLSARLVFISRHR